MKNKTTPTPATIRAAWQAASIYDHNGNKRQPSARKMAKAFRVKERDILNIVENILK